MRIRSIETSKPMCTDISCQGPFTKPNWVLEVVNLGRYCGFVFVACVLDVLESLTSEEGLVPVDVNRYVVHIIISEHVVPHSPVQDLSVVHHEPGVGSILLNQLSRFFVESLQHLDDWLVLGFIDWLKSVECTVSTPSL